MIDDGIALPERLLPPITVAPTTSLTRLSGLTILSLEMKQLSLRTWRPNLLGRRGVRVPHDTYWQRTGPHEDETAEWPLGPGWPAIC